jgi:type II secretory pathway pseudopilin PulG
LIKRKKFMKINNSGFSLLEILIYITVIAVVTLAIGSIFLSIAGGQAKADARAEVDSNLRFATDKINQDIFAASAITSPVAAGQSSNSLALTIGASSISYCLVNGQLYRSSAGICDATDEPLTDTAVKVTGLNFTRLENTNSVLPKTIISIQTLITLGIKGANQDLYSKQITSSLR